MRIRHIKGSEDYIAASPFVIDDPGAYRGCWKREVFGNENPLYLEVGMGMGQFIRTHAMLHPAISYIGFEINTTVLYKSLRRYEALLPEREMSTEPKDCNLRFIRQDARLLAEDFAQGEVNQIYLNFSDPWPKDKNANKRLTSPVFLALYDKILAPGGVIEFKTDNEGLFDYSLESIPQSGWELLDVTRDLHADPVRSEGNVMTEYEAKFSGKGNPIYKLIAGRKGEQ
ncbi:MAG: tRNA (guanosine(46)-N7)-methyltransferase TrmB [Eubacteriales bacterium]|nr:tRNA (guanosine(46)-N7)-methyltransferase TrmB [Eubacteriales bacterium]